MSINKIRTVLPPRTSLADPARLEAEPRAGDIEAKSPVPEDEDDAVVRKVRFNSGDNESKFLTPDSSFQVGSLQACIYVTRKS